MKKRCPQSSKIGHARLPGYRWIITTRGYDNVVASKEHEVEGLLFEISQSDEDSLDRFEDVFPGPFRKVMLPVLHEGKEVTALVYVDINTVEGAPKEEYIQRINKGLEDAKLSEDYVTRYVRPFIPG